MNKCKNCDNSFTGKYCNACGQKANVNDLKLKDIFHETWHSITHTDSGILRLTKDLFLRPKSVYINYFSGQRKKYFSPVTYFLITAGILIFIGIKIFDYQDYVLKTNDEMGRYIFHQTKFRTLLLLPIEIILTWLFFYKQFNLAKNIAFWLFLNGFLFTIQILSSPLYFLFIRQKHSIDVVMQIVLYVIILYHLIILFANRKWLNIVYVLLITNIIFICDYLLSIYLLLGNDVYKVTKAKSFFDLILNAYKL